MITNYNIYLKDYNYPFILFFHQEGSSRGEYAGIAKKFFNLNYNCLAVDLRYGGESNYIKNETCERAGAAVIIIDSISHCWDFLIEYHGNLQGNSFTNWIKVTPRQKAFMDRILQSSAHVIATMRTK